MIDGLSARTFPSSLRYSADQPRDWHGRWESTSVQSETIDGTFPSGVSYTVHVNPSPQAMSKLVRESGSVRAVRYGNNIAAADAAILIHSQINDALHDAGHPLAAARLGSDPSQHINIQAGGEIALLPGHHQLSNGTAVMVSDGDLNAIGRSAWPAALRNAIPAK